MDCINSKIYKAAVYLRLSREDGDVADGGRAVSNSIESQKAVIMDFLANHPEIQVCSTRIDDGFSGVDFNRPSFQAMLQDIRSKAIDCVVVKDLSRFGRNYIEAGRYIEKLFPVLGVRFIAVNDGYDSCRESEGNDMLVPFKNLINDAYARDISIKVRSSLNARRRKGDYTGAFVPYGYKKDENNHNRLAVDEYAAGIVTDIFRMKLGGMSQLAIADRLNGEGVLPPLEYKRSMGVKLKTGFFTAASPKWSYTAVTRILKNEIYTGALVQGKRTTPNYKIKKRYIRPENEWVRVENAHDSVISIKDFELVQRLLADDTRCAPNKSHIYLFAGMLVCGDCGSSMVRKTVPSGEKKYVYYVCSSNKKDKSMCSPHRISEDKLTRAVLETVKTWITEMLDLNKALAEIEASEIRQRETAKLYGRITEKEALLKKLEHRKLSLYEDLKDGILTREEYTQLKDSYVKQEESAGKAILAYRSELESRQQENAAGDCWIKNFRQFNNITKLDRNTAVTLIRRIKVYEHNRIEIQFTFASEMEKMKNILTFEEKQRTEAV